MEYFFNDDEKKLKQRVHTLNSLVKTLNIEVKMLRDENERLKMSPLPLSHFKVTGFSGVSFEPDSIVHLVLAVGSLCVPVPSPTQPCSA